MALPWPIQGRCAACLHRAEQYPSGNWRHTETRACGQWAGLAWRPGVDLPMPRSVFVADGDELPQPREAGYWRLHHDGPDEFPTSMGWHSQRQMVDYWARVREWLHEQAAREVASWPGL